MTTIRIYQCPAAYRRQCDDHAAVTVTGWSPAANAREMYRSERRRGLTPMVARRATFGTLICSTLTVTSLTAVSA